ncbi:SDR family oxidoreductase [Hyphomicrobiales bacterium]|jgi:3-oxoacyl-[acyl-carrier protein] reductase|nr:SDR family oxidoreductase [Hyphomicrobiales bacterium]MDA9904809.1 SDR family oxidoreductase [Hyphomicrobiales bacterium]|tara:strand:+ start:955 stop:1719 length:765 start_codon:yes stop_codon:yes gene_type:complete
MTKYRFSEGAAIVFGGSGGLGTGIVNLLAESGSDVAFSYHKNKESAEKNLSGIEKIGRSGLIAGVDLLDMKNVQNFVNDAKEKFGRIHSVIFATGPFLHIMPVLEAKPEDVYKTIDTDIKGFYHVLRAVVPVLKEGGGGSITALTTAAIHKYISTDGLSSIPKAGVQHLCTAIAREEGHHGIRANCVAVGLIAVGLSQEIDSPPGGILDQWMNQVPLGRAGDPKELFDAVVFLASDNAGYISGQSLPVDGGYSG